MGGQALYQVDMSRYSGNHEECPTCSLTYGRFRTGFVWEDIRMMFWNAADAPVSEWKYKSRGVILGKWFEIKQDMWAHHIETCGQDRP